MASRPRALHRRTNRPWLRGALLPDYQQPARQVRHWQKRRQMRAEQAEREKGGGHGEPQTESSRPGRA
jgi:hypothetical protein